MKNQALREMLGAFFYKIEAVSEKLTSPPATINVFTVRSPSEGLVGTSAFCPLTIPKDQYNRFVKSMCKQM